MILSRTGLSAALLLLLSLATAMAAPHPTGGTPVQPMIASGHQGNIEAIVWSPDGYLIASGGDDGTVRLWDAATGAGLKTLTPGSKGISGLAFSKDSRTLVSWDDGTAVFWNTVTERCSQIMALPDAGKVIGLTPDLQRLVIFADWRWEPILHGSGIVAVVDRRTGHPLLAFPAHGVHGDGALSPDGGTLALTPYEGVVGNSQTVRLWNLATGMPTLALTAFGDYPLPAWSPDGLQLAAAGNNGTVNVWEAATGRPLGTCLGTPAQVGAVVWSPDGKTVAVALQTGSEAYRLWDTPTGQPIQNVVPGFQAPPAGWCNAVAFAPSGKALAWADGEHLHVTDLTRVGRAEAHRPAGRERWTTDGPLSAVRGISFSPDGKTLLENQADGTVLLWNLICGQPRRALKAAAALTVQASWSYDGRSVVTGTEGQDTIQFWDPMTGRPKKAYSGRLYDMSVFAERPGGAVTVAGSVMGITFWEGANGAAERLETGSYGPPAALAWSPDGRALAVGQAGDNGSPYVWDWESRRKRCILGGTALGVPSDSLTSLAWSPDGRFLAGSRSHAWAAVWDGATGKRLWTSTRENSAGPLAWTPDGRTLVSGGGDTSVYVWDAATGHERRVLSGHTGEIEGVSVSPDGRILASAGDEGVVRLWNLMTGAELCRLVGLSGGEWLAFTPDGRFDGSPQGRPHLYWRAGRRVLSGPTAQSRFLRPGLLASILGHTRPAKVTSCAAPVSLPPATAPAPPQAPPVRRTVTPDTPAPPPALLITPDNFVGLKADFAPGYFGRSTESWEVRSNLILFQGTKQSLGRTPSVDVTLSHPLTPTEREALLTQLNAADVSRIGGHYRDHVLDAGTTTLTLSLNALGGKAGTVECSCYGRWSAAPAGFTATLTYLSGFFERTFADDPEYRLFNPATTPQVPSLPDHDMTPGASASGMFWSIASHGVTPVPIVTPAEFCAPAYLTKVAPVPPDLARQVVADYGLTNAPVDSYRIDHLVPLDLGGSNAPANLWPLTRTGPWNDAAKARLEAALHTLVCAGQMKQWDAVSAITSDWIAAYRKYVGRAPTPASAPPPPSPPADPAALLPGRTIATLTCASDTLRSPLHQPLKMLFADGSVLWIDCLTQPLPPDVAGRTINKIQEDAAGLTLTLSGGKTLTFFTQEPSGRLILRDAQGLLVLVE